MYPKSNFPQIFLASLIILVSPLCPTWLTEWTNLRWLSPAVCKSTIFANPTATAQIWIWIWAVVLDLDLIWICKDGGFGHHWLGILDLQKCKLKYGQRANNIYWSVLYTVNSPSKVRGAWTRPQLRALLLDKGHFLLSEAYYNVRFFGLDMRKMSCKTWTLVSKQGDVP